MANEDQHKAATKKTSNKPSPAKAKGPTTKAKQGAALQQKAPTKASATPAQAPAATTAARKATTRKAPAKTLAAAPAKTRAKAPAFAKPAAKRGLSISPDERDNMIRMAAYFKAEKRQFAPGFETQDWAEAEREVDDWLRQGRCAD